MPGNIKIETIKTLDFPLREAANSYLVLDEESNISFLVDAGAVENPPPLNNTPQDLILTHWHWDHAMGLVGLAGKVTNLYMARKTLEILSGDGFERCFTRVIEAAGLPLNEKVIFIKNIFLNRYNKIKNILYKYNIYSINKLKHVNVIECPGHTVDHICIAFRRAVFTGDTVLPNTRPTIIDALEHRRSLIRLLGIGWETAFPGHGSPMGRREVSDYANQLIDYRIKKLINIINIIYLKNKIKFDELLKHVYNITPSIEYFVQIRTLIGYITELEKYNIIYVNREEKPWAVEISEGRVNSIGIV